MRKIFISSDHAGFKLKEAIKVYLSKKKLTFQDLGPHNNDRVDYPDYAHKVAKRVKISKNNIGILVCGSGMGMNIAANRHCLLYTSPSPRDAHESRMPSSA